MVKAWVFPTLEGSRKFRAFALICATLRFQICKMDWLLKLSEIHHSSIVGKVLCLPEVCSLAERDYFHALRSMSNFQ